MFSYKFQQTVLKPCPFLALGPQKCHHSTTHNIKKVGCMSVGWRGGGSPQTHNWLMIGNELSLGLWSEQFTEEMGLDTFQILSCWCSTLCHDELGRQDSTIPHSDEILAIQHEKPCCAMSSQVQCTMVINLWECKDHLDQETTLLLRPLFTSRSLTPFF